MPIEVEELHNGPTIQATKSKMATMGVFERRPLFEPEELTRIEAMAITASTLDGCRRFERGELGITSVCHVGEPLKLLYAGGMLFVTCGICNEPVTAIKVAP